MESVKGFGEMRERLRGRKVSVNKAKAFTVDLVAASAPAHIPPVVREFEKPSFREFRGDRSAVSAARLLLLAAATVLTAYVFLGGESLGGRIPLSVTGLSLAWLGFVASVGHESTLRHPVASAGVGVLAGILVAACV